MYARSCATYNEEKPMSQNGIAMLCNDPFCSKICKKLFCIDGITLSINIEDALSIKRLFE